MAPVDSNPVGDEKRNPCGAAAVRALFALLMLLPPAIVAGASQVSVRQPAAELFEPSAAELPLPQDAGLEGLRTELRRLRTTGRLLHTTAHPDDEDGGMLTLESRGRGVTAELLTLTRGEGGQNRLGSNLFDELGVLRTLELLASDRYYAVQQRFTRAVDFGFSKTAQETLEKWSGPQPVLPPQPPQLQRLLGAPVLPPQQPQLQRLLGAPVLADVVRVIRTFRPDVIVSRFEGDARDGHGHHQAAAILTREAFRAAADPKAFPEQIADGLAPWQAKKLYVDNRGEDQDYTLALDTSIVDPTLGMSYQQFAMLGLRHQLSQGAATWHMRTGKHYYKLVDAAPGVVGCPTFAERSEAKVGCDTATATASPGAQEQDFFDGIDTSLPALADRLGPEEVKLPDLKQRLAAIAQFITLASGAVDRGRTPSPAKDAAVAPAVSEKALAPLLEGYESLKSVTARVEAAQLQADSEQDLLVNLETKAEQFRRAIQLASGIKIQAQLEPSAGSAIAANSGTVTPGSTVPVSVRVEFPASSAAKVFIQPLLPRGWSYRRAGVSSIAGGGTATTQHAPQREQTDGVHAARFLISIPRAATLTRPYYYRDSPEQAVYTIDNPKFVTLPMTPWPMRVRIQCEFPQGSVEFTRVVEADVRGEAAGSAGNASLGGPTRTRPVAVVPAASVMIEPAAQVMPVSRRESLTLAMTVQSNVAELRSARLQLHAPAGWKVQPASQPVTLSSKSTTRFQFRVVNAGAKPGRYKLRASLEFADQRYGQAVSLITRDDLGSLYYYQPAEAELSLLDIRVPSQLAVGYIMGAGDDIPAVLKQLGMNVSLISAEELAQGDLGRYGTIITGIRAYDVRDDMRKYNGRLLDFVRRGGTLIVQYNSGLADFNSGHYTPFPMTLGRERVTDENSPVEVLQPEDKIFRSPNYIGASDFNGWIQERGLYFMHSWDGHDLAAGSASAAPESAGSKLAPAQPDPCRPLLAMNDPGEPLLEGSLLRCSYGKGVYIYTGLAFFRQLPNGVPGAIRLFVNLVSAGHER